MTDVKDAPNRPAAKPVWDKNGPARDESRPAGTNGWLRGIIGEDRRTYAVVAAVAVAIGMVDAVSTADDIARRSGGYDISKPPLWDITSLFVIILLNPVPIALVMRNRPQP